MLSCRSKFKEENTRKVKKAILRRISETSPLVSIIIPSHNNKNELLNTLSSMFKNTSGFFEVIVVAAACSDGTEEEVTRLFPNVNLILSGDTGYGESSNIGASYAKGEYLVFLEDDMEVKAGWLNELLSSGKTIGKFGSIGSIVHYPHASISVIGGRFNLRRFPCPANCVSTESAPFKGVFEVDYLPAPLINSEIFYGMGGFDPKFFYLYDDSDLGFRLKKKGYRNFCVASSQIITSPPKAKGKPKMRFFETRNRIRFIIKNHAFTDMLKILFLNFIWFPFSAISYVKRKQVAFLKAEIAAIGWNLFHLGETLDARNLAKMRLESR